MKRKILVLDVPSMLIPIPGDEQLKVTCKGAAYWNFPPPRHVLPRVVRLRAQFDRVVFFARAWEADLLHGFLLQWLEKNSLIMPGQKGDLIVFKHQQEKGIWCAENKVDAFISDEWASTCEVFSDSPETLCCFLGSQLLLTIHLTSLWETTNGVLPHGRIVGCPTWDDVCLRFPSSRRA